MHSLTGRQRAHGCGSQGPRIDRAHPASIRRVHRPQKQKWRHCNQVSACFLSCAPSPVTRHSASPSRLHFPACPRFWLRCSSPTATCCCSPTRRTSARCTLPAPSRRPWPPLSCSRCALQHFVRSHRLHAPATVLPFFHPHVLHVLAACAACSCSPAALTQTDSNFATPLHVAAHCGNADAIHLLLSSAAGLGLAEYAVAADGSGHSALWLAAAAGHADAVKTLIEVSFETPSTVSPCCHLTSTHTRISRNDCYHGLTFIRQRALLASRRRCWCATSSCCAAAHTTAHFTATVQVAQENGHEASAVLLQQRK
jgi:hypothetical protein